MLISESKVTKNTLQNKNILGNKLQKIYSQSTIDKINELSIKEVIENENITLKKNKCKCPFHNEKTASFTIYPTTNSYYCFGCDAGGDSIKFLMEYKNLSFVDTIEKLANDFNISIEYENDSEQAAKQRNLIAKCYEVNKLYLNECQKNNKPAIEFLQARHFKQSTIDKFGIGYDAVTFHINKDITSEQKDIATNDLKILSKSGFPIFFNRVIFPIYNHSSSLVAFGGRRINDSDKTVAKYKNSYDSLIYDKSNTLYGLHFAKKHIKENVIIAEGYTDVMRSFENGFFNVVATLGTSLTESHIKLLKPYTKQITIAFDSDTAGIKASEKALELLLKQDIDADIIVLPNGHDIDSYLLENKELPQPKNLLDWYCSNKLDQSIDRKEKSNNKRKIIELVNSIKDNLLKDAIKSDIAEKHNIPLHYFNENDSTPPPTKASKTPPQKLEIQKVEKSENKAFKLDISKVTSLQPNAKDVINNFLLSDNLSEIKTEVTFAHEPQQIEPIITFQDKRVLRKGNIMMLASFAGNGKSQFCETIIASFLANRHQIPNIDTLNFDVNLEQNKKVLYIDTEREIDDVFYGMRRIIRRLGKHNFNKLVDSETKKLKDVEIHNLISLGSADKNTIKLIELIMSFKDEIGLIVLDGCTDFISDTNSLEQSQNFAQLIIGLANKFEFGVLMTVHTVSRINTKPRGHIGSEMSRKCDSMFLLKRHDSDPDLKVITTDFDYGKNRSDSDKIETTLKWCDDMRMFVTANESDITYVPTKTEQKDKELRKALNDIFDSKLDKNIFEISYIELAKELANIFQKSDRTIKRYIKTATDRRIIEKNINGNYTIFVNQSLEDSNIDF